MKASTGLVQKALREVVELRKRIGKGNLDNSTLDRLNSAEDKLNTFSIVTEIESFGNLTPLEVVVYQRVFGALAALASSPSSARELIEMVFTETSGVGQIGSGRNPNRRTGNHSEARLALDDKGALTAS